MDLSPRRRTSEETVMEFLVEMTTVVPAGTTEAEVADMRAREAANSERLVRDGTLLRLWRPPLEPGEWRTLGLFSAPDARALESALATMPLRVWRHDSVTELAPHPNDPAPGSRAEFMGRSPHPEYLVTFTVSTPPASEAEAFATANVGEAASAHAHALTGRLLRLWTLQVDANDGSVAGRALGLWSDADPADLRAVLDALPLTRWMRSDVLPLSPHPSDPAALQTA
jgi:muconolactone delta-isomerase